MVCYSTTHVCFTHFMVRARLCASPRREGASHIVNLFRKMFHVVDTIVTKCALFVSGMIRVRSLVLMHDPT